MSGRRNRESLRARRKFTALWALFKQQLGASRLALLLTAGLLLLLLLALNQLTRLPEDAEASPPSQAFVSASLVDDDESAIGELIARYYEGNRFVEKIYRDTRAQAMKRLDAGEIFLVIYVPDGFLSESRSGTQKAPIELWFNPDMGPEAYQVGVLISQHAAALDHIYGSIFGFQRLFVELGGDQDLSWGRATSHSLNVVMTYLDRNRFNVQGDVFTVSGAVHALSALLIVLSLLPALGVLAATLRQAWTDYEDRLLLASGYGPLMLARLLTGLVWWGLLILPLLYVLHKGGVAVSFLILALLLLSVYLTAALPMLALGRVKAPAVTLFQAGWLLVFLLIVLGGVLYPVSLFPSWLTRLAFRTPVYPVMQTIYQALFDHSLVPAQALLPTLYFLAPALAVAGLLGRRKV